MEGKENMDQDDGARRRLDEVASTIPEHLRDFIKIREKTDEDVGDNHLVAPTDESSGFSDASLDKKHSDVDFRRFLARGANEKALSCMLCIAGTPAND